LGDQKDIRPVKTCSNYPKGSILRNLNKDKLEELQYRKPVKQTLNVAGMWQTLSRITTGSLKHRSDCPEIAGDLVDVHIPPG